MEEKVKQLQAALLEAQVANERAKGLENNADVGLKRAKTETELAKAKALESTADLTDLHFVQEKEETKHLQDLEKGQQQFEHEVGKKAVDSMLDGETPSRGADKTLKPEVFSANNHYQKTPRNILPGMDTPEENMEDSLVLAGTGMPTVD
jgi:hypothetical protein